MRKVPSFQSSAYDPRPLIPYLASLGVEYLYEEQDIMAQAIMQHRPICSLRRQKCLKKHMNMKERKGCRNARTCFRAEFQIYRRISIRVTYQKDIPHGIIDRDDDINSQ